MVCGETEILLGSNVVYSLAWTESIVMVWAGKPQRRERQILSCLPGQSPQFSTDPSKAALHSFRPLSATSFQITV